MAASQTSPVHFTAAGLARNWRAWASCAVALVFLNASLTFENVWPTPRIAWGSAFSVELAACVLIMAAAAGSRILRWRRALAVLWVALMAGRYLDVTAPGLYGREFNLYWDSQHLGNVAAMMARVAPWWLIGGAALALTAGLVLAYHAARLALVQIALAAEHAGRRRVLGGVSALLVVLFAAQLTGVGPRFVPFADPVAAAYARQARFVLAMLGPAAAAPELSPSPRLDADLHALGRADVLLVFVESYGAVAFDTPAIADGLADSRRDLAASIDATGRHVISAFVESPTFGGSSWLAHLSLMSGVGVRDQYAYTSLMASQRETLVTTFGRRGYRTVALMPGMRQAWPEGAFYGFDAIYGRDGLEYRGPQFGWWSIPDQYALARLDALERDRSSRAPLFVVFPTSTTHAPFGPVAPYQTDWPRVLTAEPYARADVDRAMAIRPDLTNLRPSYVRAMQYEYASLAGYLRAHPDDDAVLIAIGDHQPPAAVSGKGASWEVPIHVIARQPRVLTHLRDRGFTPGLDPRHPALGPMHALVPALLDAFSGDTEPAVRRPAVRRASR